MKLVIYLLVFGLFGTIFNQSNYVTYEWIGKNSKKTKAFSGIMGVESIELPVKREFFENHLMYGEGIITTLSYPDSSSITLHLGFSVKLPFIEEPAILDSVESEDYIERSGIIKGKNWKERNYKKIPLNILYQDVGDKEKEIFELSLKKLRINAL